MKPGRGAFRIAGVAGIAVAALSAVQAAPITVELLSKADLKVAQELRASSESGWTSVIIQFNGNLTDERKRELSQLKADVFRNLPRIDSAAVRVPSKHLDDLAALEWVLRVSTDAEVSKLDEFTVGHTYTDKAWSDYRVSGSGIGIAIIDSGVGNRLDFKGLLSNRIVADINFSGEGGRYNGTQDMCGHGTHVAGIAAGNGGYSNLPIATKTYYGIARNADIISVKVLDSQGSGSVSGVLSGLDWVIDNRKRHNIRVINLSLGHPVFESYETDPLTRMVKAAWEEGIVVVTAAGNYGRRYEDWDKNRDNEGWGTGWGTIQSPANSPWSITVGATKKGGSGRSSDQVATYSSRGPSFYDLVMKPDIVAPGNQIVSAGKGNSYLEDQFGSFITVPLTEFLNLRLTRLLGFGLPTSENYYRLSGTSMSAPVVSGAVALMLDRDPRLSPDTVKVRLMASADKWTRPDGLGDPLAYGAGYLNVKAALASKLVATRPALSPKLKEVNGQILLDLEELMKNGGLWGVNGLNDPTTIWGSRAIWGVEQKQEMETRAIWGMNTDLVDGSRAIWGVMQQEPESRAIWGNGSPVVDLSSRLIFGE